MMMREKRWGKKLPAHDSGAEETPVNLTAFAVFSPAIDREQDKEVREPVARTAQTLSLPRVRHGES